jgi:phospholipid transport system substrate-binding protein
MERSPMKNQLRLISLVLIVFCLGASSAFAETPTAFVKGILHKVISVQNDPALAGAGHKADRARAIRQVIQRSFDFTRMAQNSLGPEYGRLSASQRQEFVSTFSVLFQDSYTRLVLDFLKKETIKYDRESREGRNARVNTIMIRTNETIPVDYMLRPQGQGWLLYDVIVDGVSILDNYQRQFAQVIRTNSFQFLLNKMKLQARSLK